jgi:DNA-binding transcriptional LysR family regulator
MQLTSVDTNLLVALDTLLAEGSVTRAAERLRIGQSAMSATLGRLRALFNDPLLVRKGRGLVATPLATSLKEPLREALGRLEAIVNTGSTFEPLTDSRIFTIVASDYVSLVLLKSFIATLPIVAPNIQFHVRPVEEGAVDRVLRRESDLLIFPEELLATSHLPTHRASLFWDRYVCAVDVNNPDVGNSVTVDEFGTLPYLVLNQGSLATIAEARLDALGVYRKVEMVAQSFVMAPHLIPHTRLITVMQERLARILMPADQFRLLPTPVDLGDVRMSMIWAPQLDADPGHRWLRERIAEAAAAL